MQPEYQQQLSRRSFFERVADGLHGVALTYLLGKDLYGGQQLRAASASGVASAPRGQAYNLQPHAPQFAPRAQAVIQLFMQGGPSHVDLFDPKPLLDKYHGKPPSREMAEGVIEDRTTMGSLMRSPFSFARHGRSGLWFSELLPHLARHADDLAMIRSMVGPHPNHEPAMYAIVSGRTLPGLPSLGSWVVYGLGSENQNLPAYVVLDDPLAMLPTNGIQNWQAGYLPPLFQGTRLRPTGSPILNLRPDVERPSPVTRLERDLLARLDRIHRRDRPAQLQLDARIAGYELAARMQLEAPEALDLSQESRATLEMYGVGDPQTDNYARRCLMARRLVERGVRFVQLFTAGQVWDMHVGLEKNLRNVCAQTDKPVAALLRDLRQRGLLDSTLVLWGGEFGRLPMAQLAPDKNTKNTGRDHGPFGFTSWMAGGGVKGGIAYGCTDDLGYAAVEDRVSVADWHATILHLLGFHYEELFFERSGFKEKLTATFKARVVKEILS